MSTIQTRKLEIELPENMYNVLAEMALSTEQSPQELVLEMVYLNMEMELTGGGDMGDQLAKYLCKKYNYDPSWFRKCSK